MAPGVGMSEHTLGPLEMVTLTKPDDIRLWRAAADLLDALERLLATTVFLDELGVGPAVKRCHAAVQKARGES